MLTLLDAEYPANLRAVHDRPPAIFVAGRLQSADERSVAVIGSRRASERGLDRARSLTSALASAAYTIVSGLAAGIDRAAHESALEAGARTVAVVGTGLARSYPPENAGLQREIATRGAVVSQFWPDAGPSRESFPQRNAVMSGMARATVIVEAGVRSGARIQARRALEHGRPVFISRQLLDQEWARDLVARPGVSAFAGPEEVLEALSGLTDESTLTG